MNADAYFTSPRDESPAARSPINLDYASQTASPASPHPPRSPAVPEPAAQARTASNMSSSSYPSSRKTPFFFREENAGLVVRGNFMTLAAKPEHVEKGEWLAHQGNKYSPGCSQGAFSLFSSSLGLGQPSNRSKPSVLLYTDRVKWWNSTVYSKA